MTLDVDPDSVPSVVAGYVPLALGCVLTAIAVGNYLQGAHGGSIVAGLGAILAFLLILLSN